MIPGARLLRKLVMFIAILGLLFVGVNVVAARIAESKIADAVQREFDLPARPSVHIGGFPIILNALRGTLPSISFDTSQLTVQDLTLDSVHGVLEGIHVKGIFSSDISVIIDRGTLRATVTQAELNAFLKKHFERTTIVLRARNSATVTAVRDGHTFVGTGTLRAVPGAVEFAPKSATIDGKPPPPGFAPGAKQKTTFRVAIPKLPGDIAVTGLETAPGTATLTAVVRGRTFRVAR